MKIKIIFEKIKNKIKFNQKEIGKLLTTSKSFINPLYVETECVDKIFRLATQKYELLKKRYFSHYEKKRITLIANENWRKATYGDEYEEIVEVPVYIKDGEKIDITLELPKKEVQEYIDSHIMHLKVVQDNGELFDHFIVAKNHELVALADDGVVEFETFEDYLKSFYNLANYSLILPQESENSPIHYWEKRGVNYSNHLIIKDGYYFIENSFLKSFKKREEEERIKSFKKEFFAFKESGKLFTFFNAKFYHYINKAKKLNIINGVQAKELENKWLEHQKEEEKEKALQFLKEAEEFIENSLYKISAGEKPYSLAVDENLLDSNIKELYDIAVEQLDDIFLVESKAGAFWVSQKDKIWNVKVPDNKKGLFIGKAGANIKALANEYNVKINVI